ncbi:hypothetical protein [Fischerella thermalis]|uniref:Uncharacterized protein n=1 Tax=Fischerella thermalis CCMEE 5318 TaxID=2019666 RepID=A0A2N6L9V4_9CYAN|nr:hypothetical protein [Fischerella thermalis]PMB19173.1 hypothetical protein CEN46_19240 [Fischerella thermalis CCMEE 5318]
MSTIYKVFLAWLACTEIMMPQPPSTIVVVTTNATPPAFLQELRGDDPKTIQRVAEREGFEAFQKEDAWYLIPRALLSQSQTARANRILSHLLERLSDEEAPTSFTLDSLPPTIAEEMRQALGDLATRLESDGQFSLYVTLQLRGRLKNGTSFYVRSVASVSESKVSWYTGSWGGGLGLGSQETTSKPTDAFLRQFGIRTEWGLLCFHYNSRIDGSHLKTAMDLIRDHETTQREAIQQTVRLLQERLMRNAPMSIGTVSVGELPSEVQAPLAGYLREKYNASLADLSEVELIPQVIIDLPLKGLLFSFPIEMLARMKVMPIPTQRID